MRQPTLRCIEFVETVSDWMEGALDDDQRLMLEEHLVICPDCTEYLAQLRLVPVVLREADAEVREPPPAEARQALLAEFRRRRAG